MAYEREPVHLRRRTTSTGKQSLYLDIYNKGRRRYEYLNLFLVPEKTRADREANKGTLLLAEAIRAKRLLQIRNREYDFRDNTLERADFLAFCDSIYGRTAKQSRRMIWASTKLKIVEYSRARTIRLSSIDRAWVEGFRRYLDNTAVSDRTGRPLARTTKNNYFSILKTCLGKAYSKGLISRNPAEGVDNFGIGSTRRLYLTLDEVRALNAVPCGSPELKRAFLFSCLTGLRFSDIIRLTWAEVEANGGFTRLVFRQKKTGKQEYLDISPEAVVYMGERKGKESKVFGISKYSPTIAPNLRRWAASAGIDKPITFHTGRHTFAVLMLDLGADIYTVSKLLGHRNIATTQIYADMLDKKKQAAVSMIPRLD